MLVSKLKDADELRGLLNKHQVIFLIGCNGCAEVCETGGSKAVSKMESFLVAEGKKVTGKFNIDFLCNKALVHRRMRRAEKDISDSSAILVMSCGIGVQVVAEITSKPVYPATNTVSIGGTQGLWLGEERCGNCGSCYLGITGGICPITKCTKELVNGPCGGAKNGKCEIDPEKECGWELIYNKLAEIGMLENMRKILEPRNHRNMEPSAETKKNIFWAIEK